MAKITRFNFLTDKIISGKYIILEKLGSGFEGEVYKVKEITTGIIRTAKFFYYERNKNNKVAIRYAKLLHDLSECPLIIHYHTNETILHNKKLITCLISEYVEGEILSEYILRQPKKRLSRTLALQLIHTILIGLEFMHSKKILHGDLHADNIIVNRYGLGFKIKILDMHWWGSSCKVNSLDDIYEVIQILYECLGGKKHYAKHPQQIKNICLGLKKNLITKKFKNATMLRVYLENVVWNEAYRE
ncbi:MAG: protein kinase [Gammaproteobacteria bacterium]|nr:protein kinase [Gammaproteobacteria bacterium]